MAEELSRQATTDYPAGRHTLIAAPARTGLRYFTAVFSTEEWPVDPQGTVTFTLLVKRGTRAEVAVWRDTSLYKRAAQRATTQTIGAVIDGPLPDGSSVRFEVESSGVRTGVVLLGD